MVTFLKLVYFLETAKSSSFSDAAKRLYTTQPTVSKQIASLENDLGTQLFDRQKGRVSLTEAGAYLFEELKDLPEKLNEVCLKASAIGRESSSRINVGVFHKVAGYKIQLALLSYGKQHPEYRIDAEREQYYYLCDGILSSRYDMIITDEVDLPVFQGSFSRRKLFDVPLALAVSTDSPLARRKSVSLAEMEHTPFIVQVSRETGCCSDQIDALFARAGFHPIVAKTVYSLESLFLYTSLNQGVAVIEENRGIISSPNLTLVRLDPPVSLPVCALWNQRLNPAFAQDLTDWIIANA